MGDPTLVPFYLEQSSWPFVHAVVPLALYFATRDIVLTLLLIYVWESLEFLLSRVVVWLRESIWDKVIGDPMIGALSVLVFWILDEATGWDDVFRSQVGGTRRFFGFLLVWLPSSLVLLDRRRAGVDRWYTPVLGAPLYALVYIGLALAIYSPYLRPFDAVGQSVLAWLTLVAFYAVLTVPAVAVPSPFLRVLIGELIALAAASIVFVVISPLAP
jgi:hypothetical protein